MARNRSWLPMNTGMLIWTLLPSTFANLHRKFNIYFIRLSILSSHLELGLQWIGAIAAHEAGHTLISVPSQHWAFMHKLIRPHMGAMRFTNSPAWKWNAQRTCENWKIMSHDLCTHRELGPHYNSKWYGINIVQQRRLLAGLWWEGFLFQVWPSRRTGKLQTLDPRSTQENPMPFSMKHSGAVKYSASQRYSWSCRHRLWADYCSLSYIQLHMTQLIGGRDGVNTPAFKNTHNLFNRLKQSDVPTPTLGDQPRESKGCALCTWARWMGECIDV